MKIDIGDKTIFFTVEYSKRKNFLLVTSPEGHINLKAPSGVSEDEIIEFINSQSKLLLDIQNKLESRIYISNKKSYHEAEIFLYMGKPFNLSDIIDTIPESEEEIQVVLKKIYTSKTKEIVKNRVKHFEKLIGVKANSVTIIDSPSNWGTCNYKKELTFNYKLSMAPLEVIDYVVIHELCHILHLNHDRSFWRKVGSYDHNYKQHQEYLAKFGCVMTI
ncbi:MAG TPA: M48 family peptidase [Clostridiales bacterium]|nr:M48 family peptidase [Clostridiales bacterium]